jgi:hypothetical protein
VSCDAIEADEAGVDADVDSEAAADGAVWYRDDSMTNDREGLLVAV